jgi:hypothetical protein
MPNKKQFRTAEMYKQVAVEGYAKRDRFCETTGRPRRATIVKRVVKVRPIAKK